MRYLLSIVFTLLLTISSLPSSQAHMLVPQPPARQQAEDKIYAAEDAVDKKADIKNLAAVLDKFESSFKCDSGGTTIISFVLRKSGKVTDVKVENTAGCKAPEKALAALRKIKFKPAVKDGVPVSQLYEIETKSVLVPGP